MRFSAVLLCGGKSTRMGRDKAFIPWEGMPLWELQLRKLQALGAERVLVSCRAEQNVGQVFNLSAEGSSPPEFIFDPPESDDGPLGAITRCLALVNMPLLVLAVDMPWMTEAFLRAEVLRGGFFRGAHGYEALCAVYEPAMLPVMEKALRERHLSMQRVIGSACVVTRGITAEQEGFFRNANEPSELAP
ncbi:MAG: molybdenum cofactor guanylyltransferase [Verrucomicrobiaceae bacterium]|nr:molybdenum cofactor guanylyltransferase [Verrucomicrobiaceae bacterium]